MSFAPRVHLIYDRLVTLDGKDLNCGHKLLFRFFDLINKFDILFLLNL